MILTPVQMKSIADKGRALPDEILAPLVLDVILRSSETRPEPTGERRAYVKMPDRIDELVAFLVSNPGSAMRQIAPALGLARSHACIVVRQAVQTGRIEARGAFNATRYYAPQPKSEAPLPVERKPRGAGKAQAPQKRMEAAVAYVRMHPGCRMRDIMAGIGCPRGTARLAVLHAIQDGILELRGQRVDARYYARFYPASDAADAQIAASAQAEAKPTVLLAEQRIDGEHKQTLVRLEHRRGVAKNELPKNAQQRKVALVEYVRRNPGSSLTDIAAALGCEKPHAKYAIGAARQSGEIRMEGELGKARYYPRRYLNGSATQQPAAVSS